MAAARLRALWEHPAGMKTVFFWAPTMKWGLVFASLSDMKRPVEDLSIPQCSALALTGMVWTRWSFVIFPPNPNLAGANIFVALTNLYQLSRVARAKFSDSSETLRSSQCIECLGWPSHLSVHRMAERHAGLASSGSPCTNRYYLHACAAMNRYSCREKIFLFFTTFSKKSRVRKCDTQLGGSNTGRGGMENLTSTESGTKIPKRTTTAPIAKEVPVGVEYTIPEKVVRSSEAQTDSSESSSLKTPSS